MIFNFIFTLRLVFLAAILFAMGCHSALADKPAQILIIANAEEDPYQETISGFKNNFKASEKIKIIESTLAQAKAGEPDIKRIKPDLIFALGGEATEWASQQLTTTPIVSTLVLKDDNFKKSANVTGISLSFSLKTQFQWLKKFFAQNKTVAILYNPEENSNTIQSARDISQQNGFNLMAIPVKTPKELPYALDQLSNNVDILLSIPDETVMSVNTAKEVLLASFRNKVPLVGLSDNWVKSGAFYALSWDYNDLGLQSAEIAEKLLAGARVSSISPEHPRKITYTINTKIAEHMNMEIASDLIKNAKKVFY